MDIKNKYLNSIKILISNRINLLNNSLMDNKNNNKNKISKYNQLKKKYLKHTHKYLKRNYQIKIS